MLQVLASPTMLVAGRASANALPAASGATMWAPGATTSGLSRPSWVTPRLEKDASVSSAGSAVSASSVAPTEITNGSLPGAYWTASAASPRLPAAATTTMPACHANSTAASSGSSR